MSILQDNYTTAYDGSDYIYTAGLTIWKAQTFTAGSNYTITSVKLLLYKAMGTIPGTVTVSIRATDSATHTIPDGADLCSGTVEGSSLPASIEASPCDWDSNATEITFSSPIELTSGTKYAIVVRNSGDDSHILGIEFNYDNDVYTGGNIVGSLNGGSTWTTGYDDLLFATYGSIPPIEISGSCSAEGSMTGFAFADILPIVGSCSAEGSMSGMAYVDILPITGSCSAGVSMTGTCYISLWLISGSCSVVAAMTGTAYIDAFLIIGSCSVNASMTGSLTMFLYVEGSMSATAFMTGDTDILCLIPPRRAEYDPDKFWDEETKTWVDTKSIATAGGGRHNTYLVVVSDQDKIYIGGL